MCKGDMRDDVANFMVDIDGRFIIIKNVPCHKCTQCGEVSYSGVIARRLEEMIEGLKASLDEVSIVEYAA